MADESFSRLKRQISLSPAGEVVSGCSECSDGCVHDASHPATLNHLLSSQCEPQEHQGGHSNQDSSNTWLAERNSTCYK